jgi:hypothetical protein
MKNIYGLIGLVFLFGFNSCEDNQYRDFEKIDYTLIDNDSIPPCLNFPECEIVIKSNEDYELFRREYAPQGVYEYFNGNCSTKEFSLSYQPLDTDGDSQLDPNDIIIYYKGDLKIEYENVEYKVSSYPFHVDLEENIIIYNTESPYTEIARIPSNLIYTVNPESGQVTFNQPPKMGVEISMSASRLFDEYNGISCSMDNFDFENKILIGKRIGGNGCLNGFDIELYLDSDNRRVIYDYTIDKDKSNICPEIYLTFTKWIVVENVDKSYRVKFE